MKWILFVLMLPILSGCLTYPDPGYSFLIYVNDDGSKGQRDSYFAVSESMANEELERELIRYGRCPNGWYAEKNLADALFSVRTEREIRCK